MNVPINPSKPGGTAEDQAGMARNNSHVPIETPSFEATTDQRRRQQAFSYNETDTLVQLWSDERRQRLLATSFRKKHIWDEIAAKLLERGFHRSGEQCKQKIQNLQREFRNLKDSQAEW